MGNESLREAMEATGHTVTSLAGALGIEPRTVQRWRTEGRVPQPGTARRAASVLKVDAGTIWPKLADRGGFAGDTQVVRFYPHRTMVPASLWSELTEQATRRIWVTTYASAFFGEAAPIDLIKAKAATGVSVRLNLGDPDCEQVAIRSHEERIPIADRIRLALGYYAPLVGAPGVDFHLHRTVLYATVMAFDDDLIVNQHIYGMKGFEAPILHLRADAPGDLAAMYLRSFEMVWEESRPYEPTSTGPSDRAWAKASSAA